MSQQPPRPSYQKPWLSYSQQVERLADRGLIVADPAAAERFLSHLNYYRFSGYCLAFEAERHRFADNTTFEQIVDAYKFDLALRDLLTEALEAVEVDFRAAVAYSFGQQYGAFGHVAAANFFPQFRHGEWLTRLRDETDRSSELFVKHFRGAYNDYPDLPVWIVTEVMSFGSLSRMASGMLKKDQKAVAVRYGLQPHILTSWMHHLVYVRNLCAHHSRLWDRTWAIKPQLPAGKDWQPPSLLGNEQLFATLLLLRLLLKRIPAVQIFAARWAGQVTAHLIQPPPAQASARRMGMTLHWQQHPIWR